MTKTIPSKSFWCLHKHFNDKHNICSANPTNLKKRTMFRALCFTRRQHKHQIADFIDTCSKNYALVQKYELRTVEQQTHHHCSALVYQFLFSQKNSEPTKPWTTTVINHTQSYDPQLPAVDNVYKLTRDNIFQKPLKINQILSLLPVDQQPDRQKW